MRSDQSDKTVAVVNAMDCSVCRCASMAVSVCVLVCLFSLLLNIPFHTLVYFKDGSAQTILRAATLRQKLQIKAFHLTQSQYTDIGPTSPRADPITPGIWQGSHWNANV